jgi:hypothetical protein
VQLVDEPLPRMAYHAIEADDLSPKDGKALIGKQLGPPWQKDHKLAAAAALLAAP